MKDRSPARGGRRRRVMRPPRRQPVADGDLVVSAGSGWFLLRNESPRPIHYTAANADLGAFIEFVTPDQWPSIAPGEETILRHEELSGYDSATRQAMIYWWAEGHDVRKVVVDLR